MSRQSLMQNVTWLSGAPAGPILDPNRGPLIYQDEEGEIFTLNPMEIVPDGIQRHCWLLEQSFKRVKAPKPKRKENAPHGLNPTQLDGMYRVFVAAYAERYNLQDVQRPYVMSRGDVFQRASLIERRGGAWLLPRWTDAVQNYFDPERYHNGKHTIADLCQRIDAVLAWEPKSKAPVLRIAEARGRVR